MAVGHGGSSRHAHPTALARSLPVSVPVWSCRGGRAAQGDSDSGERVSTHNTTRYQEGKKKGTKPAVCMLGLKRAAAPYHRARLVAQRGLWA